MVTGHWSLVRAGERRANSPRYSRAHSCGGTAGPGVLLLPIAYCLLPIAYCLLPVAYCLLPIACWTSLLHVQPHLQRAADGAGADVALKQLRRPLQTA